MDSDIETWVSLLTLTNKEIEEHYNEKFILIKKIIPLN